MSFLFKTCRWMGWLAVASLLGGCATAKIDGAVKSSIRTVAIARNFELDPRPSVVTQDSVGAMLVAGAAGMALQQHTSSLPNQLAQTMQQHKIDLPQMFRSAMAEQLGKRGYQVIEDETQADAVLRPVWKIRYGLTAIAGLFSSDKRLMPLMMVRVQLVNRQNQRELWWGHLGSNLEADFPAQLEPHTIDEFLNDGELLRREFAKMSRLMAARLSERL